MRKYSVNVHFDMVGSVEVDARSEEEAMELAEEMAESLDPKELVCYDESSCITGEGEEYSKKEEMDILVDSVLEDYDIPEEDCREALQKVMDEGDVYDDTSIQDIVDFVANELGL